MITPEYLNQIIEGTEEKTQNLNDYLITRIAKRIASTFEKDGEVIIIPSSISDFRKMLQTGALYDDLVDAIAKKLPDIEDEVRYAFLDSSLKIARNNTNIAKRIKNNLGLDDIDIPTYKQMGVTEKAKDLNLTPAEVLLMEEMYSETKKTVRKLTKNVASTCANMYASACDDAFYAVHNGVSIQSAVRDCIKKLTAQDITTVNYKSGKKERLEVAIPRAVRTGVNQSNAEIVLKRCAEMGIGFVRVSAHLGARVTPYDDYTNHSLWQGKVYSLDWNKPALKQFALSKGDTEGHEWIDSMRSQITGRNAGYSYPDFVDVCGYGEMLGICGINCRHTFNVFLPDVMDDTPTKIDSEENLKRYEATQKQRAMERSIRATKRRLEGLKAIETKDEDTKALIRKTKNILTEQSNAYFTFCNDNFLKARNMGLQIPMNYLTERRNALASYVGFADSNEKKKLEDYIDAMDEKEKMSWMDAFFSTNYELIENDLTYVSNYNPNDNIVHFNIYDSAEVAFHETAHAMDDDCIDAIVNMGSAENPARFEISSASALLDYYMTPEALEEELSNVAKLIGTEYKNGKFIFPDISILYDKWANNITEEFGTDGFEILSDIIDGITKGKVKGIKYWGGHLESYWLDNSNEFSNLTYESWANFCALKATKRNYWLSKLEEIAPIRYNVLNMIYEEVFLK